MPFLHEFLCARQVIELSEIFNMYSKNNLRNYQSKMNKKTY